MEWNNRASKVEMRLHGLSRWKHWKSRDGRYRVSECKWLGSGNVSTKFYASVLLDTPTGKVWELISKHRKSKRAIEACERHAAHAKRDEQRKAA